MIAVGSHSRVHSAKLFSDSLIVGVEDQVVSAYSR